MIGKATARFRTWRAGWSAGIVALVLLCPIFLPGPAARAQQEASKRRLVERSVPHYPPLARSMALEGVVKVEATVEPDGTVRTVDIKGGHPVLAQAAVNAVRKWKWEPAARETHEVVELKFAPE